jgi:hypothetical protein
VPDGTERTRSVREGRLASDDRREERARREVSRNARELVSYGPYAGKPISGWPRMTVEDRGSPEPPNGTRIHRSGNRSRTVPGRQGTRTGDYHAAVSPQALGKLSQERARQISQHPLNVEYDFTEPIVVVLALQRLRQTHLPQDLLESIIDISVYRALTPNHNGAKVD